MACIGVEIYGNSALLRSLSVGLEYRKKGVGKNLLEFVENFCK
jgi:N-acetylglutamate synthase-like GNAT family acetyltransferase